MERGAFQVPGFKWATVTKSFLIPSGSPSGIGWLLIDIGDTQVLPVGIVRYLCADPFLGQTTSSAEKIHTFYGQRRNPRDLKLYIHGIERVADVMRPFISFSRSLLTSYDT